MSFRILSIAALCGALLLAGCAAGPGARGPAPAPVDAGIAAEAQAAREAWLATHRDWSMTGRVAIRRADKGGSGRIDWTQRGDAFDVSLAAPVTRQTWRLVGSAGQVRLEGVDGGPRQGPDADQLLLETTGWEIPVQALAYWIRGQAAPTLAPAQLAYGTDGQLSQLRQGGWTIDFTAWQPPAADGTPALPARIEAQRGDARVRLIVDTWQAAGPTP
ncbi:MAG: outer membrane lipoprotein LolB [Pseudoxanthomonas spadix]|nr:MAG: outer membrane lipoprotein LolB [Pseudoxanthomonas spadix]